MLCCLDARRDRRAAYTPETGREAVAKRMESCAASPWLAELAKASQVAAGAAAREPAGRLPTTAAAGASRAVAIVAE